MPLGSGHLGSADFLAETLRMSPPLLLVFFRARFFLGRGARIANSITPGHVSESSVRYLPCFHPLINCLAEIFSTRLARDSTIKLNSLLLAHLIATILFFLTGMASPRDWKKSAYKTIVCQVVSYRTRFPQVLDIWITPLLRACYGQSSECGRIVERGIIASCPPEAQR